MNREKQYNKSINVLVKAFFAGTLFAGSCSRCAVGNLLGHSSWLSSYTSGNNPNLILCYSNTTSYTLKELTKIEQAFLKGTRYGDDSLLEFHELPRQRQDEINFNGLMAVVDILAEIHEIEDQELIKASKLQFEYAD